MVEREDRHVNRIAVRVRKLERIGVIKLEWIKQHVIRRVEWSGASRYWNRGIRSARARYFREKGSGVQQKIQHTQGF